MTMFDLIRKLVKQPESNVSFDLDGLRERNETRIAQIKAEMGNKYAHAKANYIERLKEPRPV